jgi:hypothetical protein
MNLLEIIKNGDCDHRCRGCTHNDPRSYYGCTLANISILKEGPNRVADGGPHVIKGAKIKLLEENLEEILK